MNSFYPADPVISRGSCYRTFSISASGPYSGIHVEFIAFTQLYEEFNERDCELLGLSIDGVSSPIAWVRDIEEETWGKIPFPLIADANCIFEMNLIEPGLDKTETNREGIGRVIAEKIKG